ncbi:uncharacterized protein LOC113263654 isoform X1 [Ursus arctos]|uniref:uncharacterized protein LOC113263654 isoform X1 n=1 Tax=Ursus arctos TaxID=9644 RepID=UPI002547AB0A|nr:uncharacterized protein LOC113263654 isoform X1 [Ursus arctos]XP_057159830.1 uncharacterized protein LOC113263654 isoform X1 [Ursus arctos]
MGINGNVSSTNFFLTSLVHGIGIQPETGDSHGPYPEGVYGAHLPTTSICPSGNRAAVGLYITLMISASPGRISSGIAPDYAVFVPVRAVAWPTFTGPQGIRSEEEPAPSPLTSLSWKTTRCHLSHTVSQGNGPWRAQRPASPSDAALMVYHLHGEALSTATDFQAGFAAQLMTFLWLSEKARRGLLEPRMAGFVPATEKVVQKKSLSPDRARDVIMSISCLELLNCFPLDFRIYKLVG